MEGFLLIELAIGIIGGISIFILFGSYSFFPDPFRSTLYGSIILIGIGVGLEIPLLTRLMGRYGELKDTLARALSFDYIGALVASITFPLFFYPKLGLMRTFF
jgi:spermidine synthase